MKTLLLVAALFSISAQAEIVKVPAKNILEAARTLVPQTGPFYLVSGTINCLHLNTGWAPASSNCTITVQGMEAKVKNSKGIVDAVAKLVPPTGPAFEFEGTFSASSMSYEVPPYKVVEKATINLK